MGWFTKSKEDPEVEAARQEVGSVLPSGWELGSSDRERFSLPTGHIFVWAAWTSFESERRYAIAFGPDEADAYRQVAARLRNEIEPSPAWRPPMDWRISEELKKQRESFFNDYGAEDDDLAALEELHASVPPGWELFDSDRERFRMPGYRFETYACTARGPSGDAVLAMGIGLGGSFRALKDALEGRLEESPFWVPALDLGS